MNTQTIQHLIITALLEHKPTKIGDDMVNIGHTYQEVLDLVLARAKKNPLIGNAKTTKNCVAWYASKMKNANNKHYSQEYVKLNIQRPRVSSTPLVTQEPAKVVTEEPKASKKANKGLKTAKA